jgi:hypothetical protein
LLGNASAYATIYKLTLPARHRVAIIEVIIENTLIFAFLNIKTDIKNNKTASIPEPTQVQKNVVSLFIKSVLKPRSVLKSTSQKNGRNMQVAYIIEKRSEKNNITLPPVEILVLLLF